MPCFSSCPMVSVCTCCTISVAEKNTEKHVEVREFCASSNQTFEWKSSQRLLSLGAQSSLNHRESGCTPYIDGIKVGIFPFKGLQQGVLNS